MKILFNRDFKTRDELDSYVRRVAGSDISKNQEAAHTIEGTAEELKALSLSEDTTIYGIAVMITTPPVDDPPPDPAIPVAPV